MKKRTRAWISPELDAAIEKARQDFNLRSKAAASSVIGKLLQENPPRLVNHKPKRTRRKSEVFEISI